MKVREIAENDIADAVRMHDKSRAEYQSQLEAGIKKLLAELTISRDEFVEKAFNGYSTEMEKTIYQDIFDELSKYLTAEWDKLIVYLEYGNASYSFAFYIKAGDKYIKCYDIPGVSDKELAKSFSVIDKIVSKERSQEKKALWTNMTMIVTKTGQMHSDFDYTDLSEGTYQFKKNWKKKYLC